MSQVKWCTFLLAILFFVCAITNSVQLTSDARSEERKFSNFWDSISRIVKSKEDRWKKEADKVARIALELKQPDEECFRLIESALRNGYAEEWSAKLINSNSFAKTDFVTSIVSEEYTSLGEFEDCLSVHNVQLDDYQPFETKYCLATLETPQLGYKTENPVVNSSHRYFHQLSNKWLVIRNRFPKVFALCAPAMCTTEQLKALAGKYFKEYLDGIELNIGYCQQHTEVQKSNFGYLLAIFIITLFIIISILSTLTYSTMKRAHSSNRVLLELAKCFHMGHNMKSLFKVNSSTEDRTRLDLRFVHGLKACLIVCTVFSHVMCYIPSNYFSKVALFAKYPSFYETLRSHFLYTGTERGALVIDFFFVISGFLVTHLTLAHMKKLPKFRVYVFLRWIRFIPSVIAIFCFTIVAQKLGSGPLFHSQLTDPFVKPCYDYWWTHVLFINNLWKVDQMCGGNLWFLATDFQLYCVLYLMIFLYFRNKMYSYTVAILVIIVASLAYFPMIMLDLGGVPRADYPIRFNYPAPLDSLRLVYTSPQFHLLPYLSGMFLAFWVAHTKKKSTKSSFADLKLLLFISGINACIFTQMPASLQTDESYNTGILFGAVFMFLYIANTVLGTITIYQMIFIEKSWIKQMLSAQFLVPLSRLSLAIYLINPLLIWWNVSQNLQTQPLTIFHNVQFFFSIYMQSITLAIVMFIFFEAPFLNLSRVFGKRLTPSKHTPPSPNSDPNSQIKLDTFK